MKQVAFLSLLTGIFGFSAFADHEGVVVKELTLSTCYVLPKLSEAAIVSRYNGASSRCYNYDAVSTYVFKSVSNLLILVVNSAGNVLYEKEKPVESIRSEVFTSACFATKEDAISNAKDLIQAYRTSLAPFECTDK